MKNKKPMRNMDFQAFRRKIFARTAVLIALTIAVTFGLYALILHGRFANFVVAAFQKMFRIEQLAAYNLYLRIFRNHYDFIVVCGTAVVFLIIFRVYLNWFTRYFEEINRGVDSLTSESTEDISLSPELFPMERKLNAVKHTIEKQKGDMLVAEQRKNDLIMYLAHDLKTPLASVVGYLNLLRDENQISGELREKYLAVALDKAERLEDLINEFFEISKYNLSAITLQYSKINLGRLLETLIYEFQPMLKEKNLTCALSTSENIMIVCDANKLQRVFDNLLRNAVSYCFQGTEIQISTEQRENGVLIRISNEGATIPREQLERIFEQFYRLDSSRSASTGGAGLGLAIAKEIVELHGGEITADSRDGITSFAVSLPLVGKS